MGRIIGIHPDAVVIHLNQIDTASLSGDMDASSLGIHGIFDQLFDHGSRAFDDFAGSNID